MATLLAARCLRSQLRSFWSDEERILCTVECTAIASSLIRSTKSSALKILQIASFKRSAVVNATADPPTALSIAVTMLSPLGQTRVDQ
jgi:hypothetical protein